MSSAYRRILEGRKLLPEGEYTSLVDSRYVVCSNQCHRTGHSATDAQAEVADLVPLPPQLRVLPLCPINGISLMGDLELRR